MTGMFVRLFLGTRQLHALFIWNVRGDALYTYELLLDKAVPQRANAGGSTGTPALIWTKEGQL